MASNSYVHIGIYPKKMIEDHQKNAQLDLCRMNREEILTNAAIIRVYLHIVPLCDLDLVFIRTANIRWKISNASVLRQFHQYTCII